MVLKKKVGKGKKKSVYYSLFSYCLLLFWRLSLSLKRREKATKTSFFLTMTTSFMYVLHITKKKMIPLQIHNMIAVKKKPTSIKCRNRHCASLYDGVLAFSYISPHNGDSFPRWVWVASSLPFCLSPPRRRTLFFACSLYLYPLLLRNFPHSFSFLGAHFSWTLAHCVTRYLPKCDQKNLREIHLWSRKWGTQKKKKRVILRKLTN